MNPEQGRADEVGLPAAEQARAAREWAIGRMTAMLNQGQIDGIVRLALSTRIHEARIAACEVRSFAERAAAVSRMRAEVATLRVYLGHRLARGDWHGVMDAAADIREIEAGLGVLTAGGTQ